MAWQDPRRSHTLIESKTTHRAVEQRFRLFDRWDGLTVTREIGGHALHHAGEVEYSEKDQHQGNTELHGEAETRWDDHPEENDQASAGKDRQGVTESPDGADQACLTD